MKEKVKNYTFNADNSEMVARELNFLTNSSEILNALLKSKNTGTMIGIRTKSLGPEVVLTGVEEVLQDGAEVIVVFKYYDSTGYILPSRRILLTDIIEAHPFSTPFINPYLHNLSKPVSSGVEGIISKENQ